MDISLPALGLVVWMLGWLVERYERYSADTLSPSEVNEQVAAYLETIKQMSPAEARGARIGLLSRAKEALNNNQSRASVFKWIGGGIAVGGLAGPIAALVGAVVAGTLLGRKYHEVIRLKRILPIVEALDRRAASLDATP